MFKHGLVPLILQTTKFLVVATGLCLVLFLFGAWRNHSMEHWYLFWNLLLAWVPFLLTLWLLNLLRTRLWSDWLPLLVTSAWLFFLPNTFYMLTDYIHLQDVSRIDPTFDILMFSTFIVTGVLLGFASLVLVHLELKKRLSSESCRLIMATILLLSSFAIYLGRELRWNSWDIVRNPAGILFDISDHILRPTAHPQVYIITLSFFAALSLGYYAIWCMVKAIRRTSV